MRSGVTSPYKRRAGTAPEHVVVTGDGQRSVDGHSFSDHGKARR